MLPPPELIDFIRTGKRFIAAGHKEPDGDCIGSQLALASALRRLGKEVALCSAGPFKRTEVMPYEKFFEPAPPASWKDARVILADCGSLDRTGDLEKELKGLPLAVLDHHAGSLEGEPKNMPAFFSGKAPSTTFLVYYLLLALGLEITAEEAGYLFFGLCTDTGFFRHVDSAGADAFDAAAALVRAGANPKETFAAINGGKSLDSRILMGRILSRAESYFGGRLIFSAEEFAETEKYGLEGRDSDAVYQMFQTVAGMEAIVIIRQEKPDNCTIGFRSKDAVDVSAVARQFGGGGHKNASGASVPGTIAGLKPKILASFSGIFNT